MIYVIYNTTTGAVASIHTSTDGLIAPDGYLVLGSESEIQPGAAAWVDGGLLHTSPRPSADHVFNYVTKQWEVDLNPAINRALERRHKMLQASDWSALPDVPLTTEQRAAWAVYRQDLRDITSQSGYPLNVVWPVAPG